MYCSIGTMDAIYCRFMQLILTLIMKTVPNTVPKMTTTKKRPAQATCSCLHES